jgi:hypothetical protein
MHLEKDYSQCCKFFELIF